MAEVYRRLYERALVMAREPGMTRARDVVGMSAEEYARRYCALLFGIPNGAGGLIISATSANAVMTYGEYPQTASGKA